LSRACGDSQHDSKGLWSAPTITEAGVAHVAGHLSLADLQAGYRTSGDATRARHYQVIWLLAQGRSVAETARLTSFAGRWIERLLARYNAFGPASLGDRRRGNGEEPRLLTPEVLVKLRERLKAPPDDGGQWTEVVPLPRTMRRLCYAWPCLRHAASLMPKQRADALAEALAAACAVGDEGKLRACRSPRLS
jgi:hypothetical protein